MLDYLDGRSRYENERMATNSSFALFGSLPLLR